MKNISYLIVLTISLFIGVTTAFGQIRSPISNSGLFCEFLPSGKTRLVKQRANGRFRRTSIKKELRKVVKRQSSARRLGNRLKETRRKLQRKLDNGEISFKFTVKEARGIFNALRFLKGQIGIEQVASLIEPTEVDLIKARILDLDIIINAVDNKKDSESFVLEQIRNCKRRRPPNIDSIEVRYEAIVAQGTGRAWVMGYISSQFVPFGGSPTLCLTLPSGLVRARVFTKDPCAVEDSILSPTSTSPLVTSGECERLIQRDSDGRALEYAVVLDPVIRTGVTLSIPDNQIRDSFEARLAQEFDTWGSSLPASRPRRSPTGGETCEGL